MTTRVGKFVHAKTALARMSSEIRDTNLMKKVRAINQYNRRPPFFYWRSKLPKSFPRHQDEICIARPFRLSSNPARYLEDVILVMNNR